MGSRTWVKLYCDKWLEGTIREESPLVRAVFIDLLTLAGSGIYGDTGEIKLQGGVGLSDEQVASILHLSRQQWVAARDRLIKTERIALKQGGITGMPTPKRGDAPLLNCSKLALKHGKSAPIISISNWGRYQSEYERQKPYRSNQKLQPIVTTDSYAGDRDRDIRERKVTTSGKSWEVVNP